MVLALFFTLIREAQQWVHEACFLFCLSWKLLVEAQSPNLPVESNQAAETHVRVARVLSRAHLPGAAGAAQEGENSVLRLQEEPTVL